MSIYLKGGSKNLLEGIFLRRGCWMSLYIKIVSYTILLKIPIYGIKKSLPLPHIWIWMKFLLHSTL